MASISAGAGGNRLIQFIDGRKNGLKTIRLGKRTGKSAEKIKTKVEALIADAIARKPHTAEVAKWIRQIEHRDQSLYDKLAAHESAAPRSATGQVTLGNFLNGYIGKRQTLNQVPRSRMATCGATSSITLVPIGCWTRSHRPKLMIGAAGSGSRKTRKIRRRAGRDSVITRFADVAVWRGNSFTMPYGGGLCTRVPSPTCKAS